MLDVTNLAHIQVNILHPLQVECLLADPNLRDQLDKWNIHFGLLQHSDDPFHTESLRLGRQNSPPYSGTALVDD